MHHSNLPEGAANNPFAPYNIDDRSLRFDVNRTTQHLWNSVTIKTLGSFESAEEAIAYVGNLEDFSGRDIWIDEIDLRTDEEVCIFVAEWEEEVLGGRYLNA